MQGSAPEERSPPPPGLPRPGSLSPLLRPTKPSLQVGIGLLPLSLPSPMPLPLHPFLPLPLLLTFPQACRPWNPVLHKDTWSMRRD